MTKTQANEPGFVLVPREPTKAMLDAYWEQSGESREMRGRTHSSARRYFASMLAAAPIVPAPAYGVKALEWNEVTAARSDEDPSHEPTGDCEAVTDVGIYYVECGFGSDSYVFSVSLNGDDLSNHDDPVLAKAAAQADFERRILSCLSSAPVEEADAKAGELEAASVEDILAGLELPDALRAKLVTPTASTIPSEPEAKGEAGAGPVGEVESPYTWVKTQHVPGTSVVGDSLMLLAEGGHCVGTVAVRMAEGATALDVHRALETAGNPAKLQRFIRAARRGEQEANERAETAEAALAETRERLEQVTSERDNALAAAKMLTGSLSSAHAETRKLLRKIDAQEVGR